jgi:predicted DNA-binding transcriptional regulator AlpA
MNGQTQPRQNAGANGARLPRLLTERDLADFLAVSVKTIERWRLFNEGPPYKKLGSKLRSTVRYRMDEVERWLQDQPGGGAPPQQDLSAGVAAPEGRL